MYSVTKNEVIADFGVHVIMPYEIHRVLEVPNGLVVLLKVPPVASMTENVFGVTPEGAISWQVEQIPETSLHPLLWYADMEKVGDSAVRLFNWNGWAVTIDRANGKVRDLAWFR
jgi:hypothetical protein